MSTRVDSRSGVVVRGAREAGFDHLRARAGDYLSLTKPRIIVLLLITELMSMVAVARSLPSFRELAAALIGGFCAAGGSGALNCWWDRDIDAVMRRTAGRPLPSGRLRPRQALVFGLGLIAVAAAVLWSLTGLLAASLAVAGAVYYVGIYTITLKRRTAQNIVIGGAAGAVPVLVGSAIVGGGVGWMAVALFAIIFFWTPPHSWALALVYRRDYAGATVPMLPAVASQRDTLRAIVAYLLVLVAVSLLPAITLGLAYAAPVAALDAYYLFLAAVAVRGGTMRSIARLFHYSVLYLAAVFACTAAVALLRIG